MEIYTTIAECRAARARLTGTLGFVPTMGYLHAGHLALVRRAKAECAHVAVSIFVNPTQFGPHEDLERYPRDLPRDLALLENEGVDLVFAPSVAEMYPPGYSTYVEVGDVSEPLEGAHRPGHFRGVATVVCKLFNIVQADRAYFGQKDAQQTVVIRRMVRDLNIPTSIVVVPTVRDADGLALSSRNVYLTPEERAAAPVLYRALTAARERYAAGERDAEALRRVMRAVIATEPLARSDYVSVADAETLREIEGPIETGALLSLAVRFGSTRLIDNLPLEPPEAPSPPRQAG
ncbi:pantoate--beta-alanine ligase [Kallotenue papyrolyticum]|uniref:pantoate--beta-alanine ligase n=1 Tax=Kallotenue papyrolyticum TaxID=1325125 RepID=UPI0004785C49|nr:pantoate--beta-alanine ligase [Kallotenue papyrolyticum]